MKKAIEEYMLGVTFSKRIVLVVILSHDLLEVLHSLDLLLQMKQGTSLYGISLEDVVSTAVVVVNIRVGRLLGVTRELVDFRDVGDVVGSPVALSVSASLHTYILVEVRGDIFLHGGARDLLHNPHNVIRLAVTIQINSHPLPFTRHSKAYLVVVSTRVVLLEDIDPGLGVLSHHVGDLRSLRINSLQEGYNEGRNSFRDTVLVQFMIINSVGGLHGTNTVTVHVEIILTVNETRGSREGKTDLLTTVVEFVELVVTEHSGEVSPGGMTHGDFTILTHTDKSRAFELIQPLPSYAAHMLTSEPP